MIGNRFISCYGEEVIIVSKEYKKSTTNGYDYIIKNKAEKEVFYSAKSYVKNGAKLWNRFSPTCKGIGCMGYDKNLPFKFTKTEKARWERVIGNFARNKITCDKYLCFVTFVKELRKHPQYDRIINGSIIIVGCREDGEILTNKRHNPNNTPLICTNIRTGKQIKFNNLTDLCEKFDVSIHYIRAIIKQGKAYRGYFIRYRDDTGEESKKN